MEKNPTKRFTTEEALTHPWLVLTVLPDTYAVFTEDIYFIQKCIYIYIDIIDIN